MKNYRGRDTGQTWIKTQRVHCHNNGETKFQLTLFQELID